MLLRFYIDNPDVDTECIAYSLESNRSVYIRLSAAGNK